MLIRGPTLRGFALTAAIATAAVAVTAGRAAGPLVPAPSAKPAAPSQAKQTIAAKPLLDASAAAREADRIARFDAAIAPARDHALSDQDVELIREAISAYARSDSEEGLAAQAKISDPVGRKLADWYRLRSGTGEAAEYRAFLDTNPAWPDQSLLSKRFEEALFLRGGSSRDIRQAFAKSEPETGAGLAALASAYLAEGNETKAAELSRRAWREYEFPDAFEAGFQQRFERFLAAADYKRRFDRLLTDEARWDSERRVRAAAARRLIPRLGDEGEQKKAQARLAVYTGAKTARKLMAALPADGDADWGLAFQRVQHLRRLNKDEDAWKILVTAPTDEASIVSPDGWWLQRRAAAYGALQAGKPRMAFDLVRDAGALSVNALNDQTFMAGWLALRHLNDPRAALPFLEQNEAGSDGPLSRSRALYWLGRTHEALGDKNKASGFFESAAQYGDTFHGHLARDRLGSAFRARPFAPPALPTSAQADAFNGLDATVAAVIATKANVGRGIARAFLTHLSRHLDSEAEVAMVAHLAEALGDTQQSLRIGKTAIARGMNLVSYAYPIHAFPAYEPLREPPETALLLGLARQESEFNTTIMSGAGARGILQVMPVTARHVCKDYKIKCDIPRLMRDPSYNAMLASAYVGDRMADVDGSYILALTSYNAGPGRTRQWIRQFGDPRDPKVDPVDWIFRIPFEETRDYVQKVLSNVQIYRERLGHDGPEGIGRDLVRARRVAGASSSP